MCVYMCVTTGVGAGSEQSNCSRQELSELGIKHSQPEIGWKLTLS